jgi:hypothetical protein
MCCHTFPRLVEKRLMAIAFRGSLLYTRLALKETDISPSPQTD